MNPRPRRPGVYPAPCDPGAPPWKQKYDKATGKYSFEFPTLSPEEEVLYRRSQVYQNWESIRLSLLHARDMDDAARNKEIQQSQVRKEKKREERQRKYEKYKRQMELKESGEGTSSSGPGTGLRLVSIMDSLRDTGEDNEEDGFERFKSQLMAPSITSSLKVKSNGGPQTSRARYEPTERELMLDRIALQKSANSKEHALPSTSTAKRPPRRMEHAEIPDFNEPSTSSSLPRSSMEVDSESDEEEEAQDTDDEDFVPQSKSSKTTSSKYSLRARGAQTKTDKDDEDYDPLASKAQKKKTNARTKTTKNSKDEEEETEEVETIWRPLQIDPPEGPAFYQVKYVADVLSEEEKKTTDKERDELIYIEQGAHSHEAIRLTFYRALWRQFHGFITFETALELLMKHDYSIPKALASIDKVLEEQCENFQPIFSLPEVKYRFLEPLIKDHQQSDYADTDKEDIFSLEDCKQFFWFCRDQHLEVERRSSRLKTLCHCQDEFTRELIFEPRWGCSNCSKKNRGANRLCLICQLYQEQEGKPFPATNVHFTSHDLKQLEAWETMEIREKRSICREEFEKLQKEEEEKFLERVRQMKSPHTDLRREEYEFVKKYYTLRRDRAIRLKKKKSEIPREFEKLSGKHFANLLKPRRLTFFKDCDCPPKAPTTSVSWHALPPKKVFATEMVVEDCGEEDRQRLKTAIRLGINLLMAKIRDVDADKKIEKVVKIAKVEKVEEVEEDEEVKTEPRRTRMSLRGAQ